VEGGGRGTRRRPQDLNTYKERRVRENLFGKTGGEVGFSDKMRNLTSGAVGGILKKKRVLVKGGKRGRKERKLDRSNKKVKNP